MRLYGEIHAAMHGELHMLKDAYEQVEEWVDEYPHFEEMGHMAEAMERGLQQYEKENDIATVEWKISTESSAVVLVFLNDLVEAYPEVELAVAAKLIYSTTGATEYFSYYSPEDVSTIFAAPEDPFSDENRVIASERDWYEDDWDIDGSHEKNTSADDYLYSVDWGFPEEAEWIPFCR